MYLRKAILIKCMYMENSMTSRGLESFLCKHLAWWEKHCGLSFNSSHDRLFDCFASCRVIFSVLLMITSEHSL